MVDRRRRLVSLKGFIASALMLLGLTAVAGYAIGAAGQPPVTGPEDEHLKGPPHSGVALSAAELSGDALPNADTSSSADARASRAWGILAFKSQSGLTCLTVGQRRNGEIGYRTPNGGFAKLDPADAPASCGDIGEDLRRRGAIAMIAQKPVDDRGRVVSLLYGAVGPSTKALKVKLPSGVERPLRIDPTASLNTIAGTFLAPLPYGHTLEGVSVLVSTTDGATHEIEF